MLITKSREIANYVKTGRGRKMLNFKKSYVESCLNNTSLNRTIPMREITQEKMWHIMATYTPMKHIQRCGRAYKNFCFYMQVAVVSTNINSHMEQ